MNFKTILPVFAHVVVAVVCKQDLVFALEDMSTDLPESVTESHEELVEQQESTGKKLQRTQTINQRCGIVGLIRSSSNTYLHVRSMVVHTCTSV